MTELEEFGKLAATASRRYQGAQDTISDALREAISNGVLRGGQQLKQEVIAAQFGVSKIPVREALKQLEGEGLVTFYPRSGAMVSELTYAEVQEVGEIRATLETLALRWAMPRITEEELRQAESILDRIDLSDPGREGLEDYGQLNWSFHHAILAPSNRPRLLALIKTQHAIFQRYLRVHPGMMEHRPQGQQEHRQILDFCRRGDLASATLALDRHIETVIVNLSAYFDRGKRTSG